MAIFNNNTVSCQTINELYFVKNLKNKSPCTKRGFHIILHWNMSENIQRSIVSDDVDISRFNLSVRNNVSRNITHNIVSSIISNSIYII